jgi:hypothetical protein
MAGFEFFPDPERHDLVHLSKAGECALGEAAAATWVAAADATATGTADA